MIRYLIRITYDGSNYYGFQRLNSYPTIQSQIEIALSKIFKEKIDIKGAGRTDRYVHALDQCASFDAPFYIKPSKLTMAINRHLPKDIRIKKSEIKDSHFHARFSVKEKVYEYRINVGEFNPLFINYYYQPERKIIVSKLKKAAKLFIGTHDYNNFVSGENSNTISNVKKITITKRKNIITIKLLGTHFYKYMVRNIVGALIDYNNNKTTLEEIKMLLSSPEKSKQLTTISPKGLYLTKIYY